MKHWDIYMETRGKYPDQVIIKCHHEDIEDPHTTKRREMYEGRGKTVVLKIVGE